MLLSAQQGLKLLPRMLPSRVHFMVPHQSLLQVLKSRVSSANVDMDQG